MLGTIIAFIVIFTVVVVAHEFGHFLLAKNSGIKVKEFSVGMGPLLFKKTKGETDYVIRLLPIGGACMFEGEDGNYDGENEEPKDLREIEGTFQSASVWGRIATVVAGPLFNIILAYLLAIFLCWFCGADIPVLDGVAPGSAAEEAGIQAGDTIVAFGNQRTYLRQEITVLAYLSDGSPMDVTYERDGVEYTTTLTPKYSEESGRYLFGLDWAETYVDCSDISVFKYSAYEVRYWLLTTFQSLGYLFSGNASAEDVSGPVGIAQVIDNTIEETSQFGLFTVILNMINITVLLSINLGVMNLLPFPALDGGRLVFLLIEAVRGKPISPEKEGLVHMIGFVALMILMVFVLFNDIMRIVG